MVLPKILYQNLKRYFGYNDFRPRQKEVLRYLFAGNDLVAILPTGSGKSLCYQLPATCLSGLVVVVSPLISLMKDQVDSLRSRGIRATYINSSLNWSEQQRRLKGIIQGDYNIIYIAPERFESNVFLDRLTQVKVALFAIDEAHCISEWGHDFRPSYLKLAQVRKKLGNPRLIALTATATPEVRKDIIKGLGLRDFKLLIKGFERRNLYLEVKQVENELVKKEELLRILTYNPLPAIVYVGTRNRVEEIIAFLEDKFSVIGYHGGMKSHERRRSQELFMAGSYDIVIATNAFGMGVDKSDVRLVVHYELPGTLEAYYQEIGRAGRDGFASKCILLYQEEDSDLREFFIDNDYPQKDIVEEVYSFFLAQNQQEVEVNFNQLYLQLRNLPSKLALDATLRLLRKEGYLKRISSKDQEITYQILEQVEPKQLEIDYLQLQYLKKNKYQKLSELKGYIGTKECRHQYILNYFGDEEALNYCPGCDNCDEVRQTRVITKELGILVQKILSCVIKLGGRFGVTTIAKVLTGSKSKKLLGRGLDKVSTYGIVNDFSYEDIISIIEELIEARYLKRDMGRYPTVQITKAGYKILHQPYNLDWNLVREEKEINNLANQARLELLNKLKDLRTRLSKEFNQAPFIIAHDKTLEELVRRLPKNREEMLKVRGFGEVTYRRYGESFLKVIQEFLQVEPELDRIETPICLDGTYEETFNLYKCGLPLEDISKERGLAVGTIVDHLSKLIESGVEIDTRRFISASELEEIRAAIAKVGYQTLKEIKELVNDEIDYNKIKLVVAGYKKEFMPN
ncbi:hypothetical protein U472_07750 [Orenia metallireducens]|jgi:ATP-dependent DNA helicase RecQ|uniref:ATP-dependent DNA helicase RecQ n=1 Tax=Orenia metallireducens TaxID=1413210 RepID=A0A1C0AAM7_9FIRM|nr:ATP-dependent DNA helicase RecQ [Orenia metallireducens]OCL27344.1 hypothetical protein U472_07750 [Orenia metallireducens]